ncbi:DNA repair helicase XPB [Cohnella faecalis]|uniref:DNA repair helicase XPB n=1 Tax=Cohnella faecalis TaxID=2315694 RepID=UPI0018F60F66|nr:DNA repair helicase XPB [Cohnella faecalis]
MGVPPPLLIQSDGTILLDERHPRYEETRETLRQLAELQKRPGPLHTYRLTPVTLWNAAAAGWTADRAVSELAESARYGLPGELEKEIRTQLGRYGLLRLDREDNNLVLRSNSEQLLREIADWPDIAAWVSKTNESSGLTLKAEARGFVKRELAARGYPVLDEAGFRSGEALSLSMRSLQTDNGRPVRLRDYQSAAVDAFLGQSAQGGGSGVVVLPCGAGKTWVGMETLVRLQCETLILTPNAVSVTQWIRELRANTSLSENEIGEYTGTAKQVRPVTVATYQVLTHRRSKDAPYPHWKLFVDRDWGLIIYDEVHLLPAPVFRMTADIQATRRLGLTATLVREDGREEDVFALIGPKKYDVPWKQLEAQKWIAEATCTEIRVPMGDRTIDRYRSATVRARHRIAGENPVKTKVVRRLLSRHEGIPTLVIGQYLDQLHGLSRELALPLVTGEMPHKERRMVFDRFNRGEIGVLLVSKVANFAVDLPDAAVAIQLSGSFGSRQEEAQRLGRILRPKKDGSNATFYSLVSEGTDEVDFARNRGRFLIEQGYTYSIDREQLEARAEDE